MYSGVEERSERTGRREWNQLKRIETLLSAARNRTVVSRMESEVELERKVSVFRPWDETARATVMKQSSNHPFFLQSDDAGGSRLGGKDGKEMTMVHAQGTNSEFS